MKHYELIHEIYNLCDGQPDSQIKEVDVDDLDVYMKSLTSKVSTCEKTEREDGSVVYEVVTNGVKERYTFTEA